MNRRAFALIELLVVLGIIAFLVAIVLPAFRLAREYAKSTRCYSNIKQITLKLIAYDLKNENFPYGSYLSGNIKAPPGFFFIGDASYDTPGWRWHNYICDDENIGFKNESVFWCPSRRMQDIKFKNNVLVANYGVNQSICKSWISDSKNDFTGALLSSTDIKSPDRTLLIADSGYYLINWYHAADSPPVVLGKSIADRSYLPGLAMNKDRNLLDGQKDDAINGRHFNKSVNIGYVDGHVERRKAEDLFVEKTADGYKNLSPLWIPKTK